MLNQQTLETIERIVTDAEGRSACELVVTLARRSDDYTYILLFYAAITAMLAPLAVLPFLSHPVAGQLIVLAEWLLFLILALLFQTPALRKRLVPRKIRLHQAARLARQHFVARGMNGAKAPGAILLFVAFEERYVEILTNAKVPIPDERWRKIVDRLLSKIREGRLEEGLVEAVETIAETMAEACPSDDKEGTNRYPNALTLI